MAPSQNDIDRIHERLDTLVTQQAEIAASVARIEERCPSCQRLVEKHESAIYGNGKAGLLTRMASAEQGRVDTLSVRSLLALLGAVGTLAATVGTAIGSAIAAMK